MLQSQILEELEKLENRLLETNDFNAKQKIYLEIEKVEKKIKPHHRLSK